MTKLKFRIIEMVLCPLGLIVVDGLMHLSKGTPFMTEFLWGGVSAIAVVRGLDALRAAKNQWPET